MANIPFSNFGSKLTDLNAADAKIVKDKLSENLKAYLLNKVPESKRVLLAEKFKTVPIDLDSVKEKSLSAMINDSLLIHFSTDDEVKEILASLSKSLSNNKVKVASVIGLDVPLKANPAFKEEYYKAKTKEFGTLINLPEAVINRLLETVTDIDDVDDQFLKKLVVDRLVTPSQKSQLEFAVDLSRLSGENVGFIKALHNNTGSVQDFIMNDAEDWKKLLTSKRIPVPADEKSMDSYANHLVKSMEMSFPQTFFLNRLIHKKEFSSQLKTFDAFHRVNGLGKIDFIKGKMSLDNTNWTGVNVDEKKALLEEIEVLQQFIYTYKYLGITEILAGTVINAAAKKQLVIARLAQLTAFYNKNQQVDFAQFDFFDPAARLDFSGVDPVNKPLFRAHAMAFQRMLILGGNTKTAQILLANGFSSSWDIIHADEAEFVKRTGLELNEAKQVFTSASKNVAATSHFYQAIRDAKNGGFNKLTVNNIMPMVNDLRRIDGYDQLFGNQDFCDCEHCRSIFSPAAYFTDLMLFADRNVTQKTFTVSPDHPLKLKNRRPDLWTLPLTCHNTSTEIPYLDVVNNILEQYIQTGLGNDKDVYEELAGSELSCALPFNLPLTELRAYIGHFNLSLAQVYKILGENEYRQKQELLGLSDQDLTIVGTPDPAKALIRFGNPADINKISVAEFIRFAGISRSELDALLAVKSNIEIFNVKIEVKESADDIQQYEEVFKEDSLTNGRLDIIQRFLKLWKKTPWTIPEFDMIVLALHNNGSVLYLEEKDENEDYKILLLSDIIKMQEVLKLNVEELCSIIYEIPEIPLRPGDKTLYERLFNLKEIFGIDPITRKYNTVVGFKDTITPYLLAGLSISEHELHLLFKLLGINNTEGLMLTKEIISRLYRQSRLASGLKLDMEDFIAALNSTINGKEAETVAEIIELSDRRKWIATSPFSFQNLDFIINGIENSEKQYSNDLEKVKALVHEIQVGAPLQGSLRTDLLKNRIQQIFTLSGAGLAEDILKLITGNINDQPITNALNSDFVDPGLMNPLVNFLQETERKIFAINKLNWRDDDISFFCNNLIVFGIPGNKKWSADVMKAMLVYTNLLKNKAAEIKTSIKEILQSVAQNNLIPESGINTLASIWYCSPLAIYSVINTFTLEGIPIDALNRLYNLLSICQILGIQPESLIKLKNGNYKALTDAKNVIIGAFASKYTEEKTRLEKLQPYHDKINTLKRDAICDYIIAQQDKYKFKDRSDLYYFFLLDVEMSGCFRTSNILAAISSLQLYIQRCLMNLEQSDDSLNPDLENIRVTHDLIPADEWEWRKNYRVWEANRKVFLYPENYIDPALRDTKTPQFKELEDELLQQKITLETAEASYKKYLMEFLELASLRYAGAYYYHVPTNPVGHILVPLTVQSNANAMKIDPATLGNGYTFSNPFVDKEKTKYYLFARTHLEPYQYFFRTVNVFNNLWGHWEKIDLPIEAEEVSAIIHNGKLRLYWTEVQHQELTKIDGGTAKSENVIFKVTTKYSEFDENKWSSPQRLYLGSDITRIENIYDRIMGLSSPLEEDDNNKKDAIIDQYKLEVFRKPYIAKTGSAQKLELRHIYTSGRIIQNVAIYGTKEYRVSSSITIPPHFFKVINGNFFDVPDQFYEVSNIRYRIELRWLNGAFLYAPGFVGIEYVCATLEVERLTPLEPLSVTSYIQEIYKYIKDPNRSFIAITESFRNDGLEQELYVAYQDNGTYMHFVEDGNRNFVSGGKTLTQFKEGLAHLKYKNGNGILQNNVLSTILSDELQITLFEKGLESFLSLQTQNRNNSAGQTLNFTGSYGAYYWEMFFHIPFLIANHLNANQDFKGAKWWYERIFNPTSDEKPISDNPGEHYWQFREFRNLDITRLKDIFSDESTIAKYKRDPFDPHAIAMLRISAYQKAIVQKYIDNLLDWGDFLFTQDTQESLVEANMLYQLARDILGKRPEKTGKCKTANEEDLIFENIASKIDNGSEFLINLENVYAGILNQNKNDKAVLETSKYLSKVLENLGEPNVTPNKLSELAVLSQAKYKADLKIPDIAPIPGTVIQRPHIVKYSMIKELEYRPLSYAGRSYTDLNEPQNKIVYNNEKGTPEKDLVNQSKMAFCVPVNENLLQYWDRVEDRLFKIRNCMNISGIRRSLALYQPPIDPMLLVRAKAAGLSIEEIVAVGTGAAPLPNYRFVYMLEKAKQFAQTVQGFGSALLSALEKKDGEELTLLRSVHERNILRLTKDIKKRQVQEAQKQYVSLEESITNIQNRIDYYNDLIDEGLTGWETTQQVTIHTATGLKVIENRAYLKSSIAYLIAQLGSIFSLNWGGKQMGDSAVGQAKWYAGMASSLDAVSASAGLEASFQRREQEWKFQLQTAKQEIKQATQQLLAADLRIKIAERDQDIHEKTIEQSDEVHEFLQDKFTNMELYNYIATSLNRLYRMSYTMALDMAKQAEQCYRTETFDEAIFIEIDNWQNDFAGLLSGERLILQLQRMEKAYMDQNTRQQEITQSFSLVQINPVALLQLRQTGKFGDGSLPLNNVWIPEIAFDLLYPGQYQRIIKSVRISIPCIAGPYTNISAKLTLKNSLIRKSDKLNSDPLTTEQDTRHTAKNTCITTSSSQNDGGVFELNFRDERYLPFEGAGAISQWQLELPTVMRSFNYNTISDVIFHISYTAKDDGTFRATVENNLQNHFMEAAREGLFRLLSLKNDFPDDFHRMKSDSSIIPLNKELKIDKSFFPYFAGNYDIIFKSCIFFNKNTSDISFPITVSNAISETIDDNWTLKLNYNPTDLKDQEDIYVMINYSLSTIS